MRAFVVAVMVLVCAALALPEAAHAERRIALVVGNSAYENIQPLRNPSNDAALMASALRELGFEVTLATDADRRGMARMVLDFGRNLSEAGQDAVGLFFYAGHGVQASGTNYLLPVQALIDTEADLEIEAIDTNWVLAQMNEAGNGLNMVILDACRNNPYEGSFRSSSRGLARLDAPSGSLVAYSAAPGQVALDGEGDNSPYTSALVEAMREPGVELLQVFRQVRLDVESETGGRQTPWEEQSLREDFYFTAALPSDDAPGEQERPPEDASQNTEIELAFWNSVKDSDNPAVISTYLDRYPNGIFAELARVLIASLTQGPSPEEPPPVEDTPPPADPELPRHIQSALAALGCNPGPVDGVWGNRSQSALESFAEHASVDLPVVAVSAETLILLEGYEGRICPLRCGAGEEERNGTCVALQRTESEPAQRTFANPTIRGLPVDICVSWSSLCDGQAALRFCQDRGYTRVVSHATQIYPETAHISGGSTCRPSGLTVCGGYSEIVCAR